MTGSCIQIDRSPSRMMADLLTRRRLVLCGAAAGFVALLPLGLALDRVVTVDLRTPRPRQTPAGFGGALRAAHYRMAVQKQDEDGLSALPHSKVVALRRAWTSKVGWIAVLNSPAPARARRLCAIEAMSSRLPPLFPRLTGAVHSHHHHSRDPLAMFARWHAPRYELLEPDSVPQETPAVVGLEDGETVAASLVRGDAAVSIPGSLIDDGSGHRRTAVLGVGGSALQFDDRPGQISTTAETGLWNGAPATAMGLGYTLPNGWARLNAAGVVNNPDLATEPKTWTLPKTFGVSAAANIALN